MVFRLAERLGKTVHELMTGRAGEAMTAIEETHWRAFWKAEYGKEDDVIDDPDALVSALHAMGG